MLGDGFCVKVGVLRQDQKVVMTVDEVCQILARLDRRIELADEQ